MSPRLKLLLAVIFCIIALVMLLISVCSKHWIKVYCLDDIEQDWAVWEVCHQITSSLKVCVKSGWVVVCSCLVFLALLSMVAVVSIGMAALWAIKPRFYMIAGGLSIFTGLLLFLCLIIYPIKFSDDIRRGQTYTGVVVSHIDLYWSYGVAWGAFCFVFAAALLFLLPAETQAQPTH